MNNELVQYIENEIFPLYNRNEEEHGINHIKTVIKRIMQTYQKKNNKKVQLNRLYLFMIKLTNLQFF